MSMPSPAEALRVMLDNPDLFPAVRKDLDKQARALLKKQAKATRSAEMARAMTQALGEELVGIALEGLNVRDVAALLRRLDKHNDTLASLEPLAQRQHLAGLFTGARTAADPRRGARPIAPKKVAVIPERPVTEADKIMRHKSMGARRLPKAGSAS